MSLNKPGLERRCTSSSGRAIDEVDRPGTRRVVPERSAGQIVWKREFRREVELDRSKYNRVFEHSVEGANRLRLRSGC